MRFGPITGLLATAMAAVLLAACGGGGGKDTTPDAFDFGVLDNAAPGIFHLSQAITVSGVSAGVDIPITIEGEGCAYSTGDGFSTETGNVRNGDIVRVLLKAPAAPETEAACTVDIGGITGSFTLTTGTNAFAMNVIPGHLVFTWAGFNGVGNGLGKKQPVPMKSVRKIKESVHFQFGNHQYMALHQWIDIQESVELLVFRNPVAGYFPLDYFAE